MKFFELMIKRDMIPIALSLLIVILGVFAIFHMPVRLFPKVTRPVISITTTYPGASAEVVQGFVTSRIEDAIAGLANVDYVTASSMHGMSAVNVYLTPNSDIESAVVQIMQKVDGQKAYLPSEVKGPTVEQASEDSPVMIVAFTSEKMSHVQSAEYLRRVVAPELALIDGVGQAEVLGPQYAVKVQLNPTRLSAYALTANDVLAALNRQNVLSQAGSIEGSATNIELDPTSALQSLASFNALRIKTDGSHVIHLQDIGHATFAAENSYINPFFNGRSATMMFIEPVSGANPLTVSQSVEKVLTSIRQHLPYDMQATVVVNVADYIHASIREVLQALLIAFGIILLVLVFFLGSWRVLLIPFVTIPVSLIGGLLLTAWVGYSINTLTLLALVLAVGLVVDDAIVVVENIFRHLSHTESKMSAALNGTHEIYRAIIAMTLTLIAVLAPIFFMGGMTGKLFSEFAFTLAASVLISGLVALTLTPMMCAKFLTKHAKTQGLAKFSNDWVGRLQKAYQKGLTTLLNKKMVAVIVWLLAMVGSVVLYQVTPKKLAPTEDQGYLQVIGQGPARANQHYILTYRPQVEQVLSSLPERKNYLFLQGIPSLNGFLGFVTLQPFGERKISAMQLQPQLQSALDKIAGIQAYIFVPSALPGSSGGDFSFVITSASGYDRLYVAAKQFEQAARASGLFAYLQDDLHYDQPSLQLSIHRNSLEAHQVSMDEVTGALSLLTGGLESQQFNYFGRSYDVVLSAYPQFRDNPDKLSLIKVRNASGDLVPLSSLMTARLKIAPSSLNEFQKQDAVTLTGMLRPGVSMSAAIAASQQMANRLFAADMRYDYSNNTRQYLQESSRFLQTFALALVIIFLVLSIQFNSLRDALIILLGSVPMAIFSALLPLKFGFGTINIYTQIALLTLVGLVAKHGVLMASFANELKAQGLDKLVAIQEAAVIRFRPILMTSVAMILGALPLVMASGAGSVSRFQMGLLIAFGLLIGTICTLFVFPVLYQIFSRAVNHR